MQVQWAVHVPQAMQRHGASLKPCGDTAGRKVKAESEKPQPPVDEKAEH